MIPEWLGMVINVVSALAAAGVSWAAWAVLNRMSPATARPIKWSYVLIFGASGGEVVLSGVASVVTWPVVNDLRHLMILLMLAGMAGLFLTSRRKNCLCPDCPGRQRPETCEHCDERGGQGHA